MTRKSLAACVAACLVGACAAPVGERGPAREVGSPDPLAKYAGTYSVCKGHERTTFTFTPSGARKATIVVRYDVFDGAQCSGAIAGTRTFAAPMAVTWLGTSTGQVSGIGERDATLVIDRVNLSEPHNPATMTGPGVHGACVRHSGGEVCYRRDFEPASNEDAALLLRGTALHVLIHFGDSWRADPVPWRRSD
jgi:hypothetical protein